ncbi:MAG: hypothetical protein NVSMB17_11440 [Candidatus Dormibacteria bacterium]
MAALLALLALTASVLAAAHGSAPVRAAQPFVFQVGVDQEDITPPNLNDYVKNKNFFLGGYGLSNVQVGGPNGFQIPQTDPRYAQGVMKEPLGHPFIRVIVVSDGSHAVAFADLDNQGTFPAYKLNEFSQSARPWGFDNVRAQVAKDTNGKLNFASMTISSDHSHGGQDMTGVWGFVPDEYLKFVYDQEVKAFENALKKAQPATIQEGAVSTPGPCDPARILNDQLNTPTCDGSDPNDIMDTEMRVMQGFAVSDGHKLFTLANFAAHATVMGGGNRLISPDWPGVTAKYLQTETHADLGAVIVGSVGRSQPNRSDCTTAELGAAVAGTGRYDVDTQVINGTDATTEPRESCKLSKYAHTAADVAERAIATATPLTYGKIDGREVFMHDCATNPSILAFNYVGDPVGAPIARANTPPYAEGNCIGTWVGTFRIGDILFTTNPGEAYPNIRDQFMKSFPGGTDGARRYWTASLANDQLGYLIAPFPEGYPTAGAAGARGNDNILFNTSATIGDHVMCTQVYEAIQMGLPAVAPTKCAPYRAETLQNTYIGGVDTGPAPDNPPPSGFSTQSSGTIPEAPLTAALLVAGLVGLVFVRRWQRAAS